MIGAFRNFELNQMEIDGTPGRAFFPEEEGVPAYDELIFVAHRARAKDPRFRAFVDAMERGVHFTINQPDEAWALFTKGRQGARQRAQPARLARHDPALQCLAGGAGYARAIGGSGRSWRRRA